MPRNGTGTYSLPQPPFVAGTVISSSAMNDDLSDIASALTASLPRDGQAGMSGQFKAIDGSTSFPSISFNNDPTTGFYRPAADELGIVVGGAQVGLFTSRGFLGTFPIGGIIDFPGPNGQVPDLWLQCFGQAISRTTYAALFTIMGTNYGSGDGSTTFNIPDLRGLVIAGLDNMGGVSSGRLTSTFFGNDPTVLGARGGIQDIGLAPGNIPTVTSDVSVTVSVSGSISGTTTQQVIIGGPGIAANAGNGFSTSFVNVNGSFSGGGSGSGSATSNNTGGGTPSPFTIVQPTMVMNKIIFAGAI